MTIALAHISDLHFGSRWFTTSSRPYPSVVPPGGTGAVKGFRSHDIAACDDLVSAIAREHLAWRGQNVNLRVLAVTGDLTSVGEDSEFANALTFIHGTISEQWSSCVGLGKIPFDARHAVPGNHDHWGGWRASAARYAWQPRIHGTYFQTTRQRRSWFCDYVDQNEPLVLQLMGIDTCSAPNGHWFAEGHIDRADLFELEKDIQDSNVRFSHRQVLRILLAHHGLSGRGRRGLCLDAQSEGHLVSFMAKCGVHRLFTGHLHDPEISPHLRHPPNHGHELRCGTTLQYAKAGKQTFLTHLATLTDAGIELTTTVQQRTVAGGFQPSGSVTALLL
jgi:hypothetical protein